MDNCIFCGITSGTQPAQVVYQDKYVTAFWTIQPVAPIHLLIIPNKHIGSLLDVRSEDEPVLGHMLTVAAALAQETGVASSGFRIVINNGQDAGQSVYHLHMHLIGGQQLPFSG